MVEIGGFDAKFAKSSQIPPAIRVLREIRFAGRIAEDTVVRKYGGSTPVPMVAMDSGLLESRLDRLDAPDRMVGVKARAHGPRLMDRLSERT